MSADKYGLSTVETRCMIPVWQNKASLSRLGITNQNCASEKNSELHTRQSQEKDKKEKKKKPTNTSP